MRTNRGLIHASDDRRPRDLILVQAQDEDLFWCNVAEPGDIKSALRVAAEWAKANRQPARVVKGPKREIVRVIEP